MAPLEAARMLAEYSHMGDDKEPPHREMYWGFYCWFCGGNLLEGHESDCPWLQMPQIVEALERLEGLEK